MTAHDRHLAAYRAYTTQAFCHNRACADHGHAVNVLYEEENGQGAITPEECASCKGNLQLFVPPERL